MNNSINGGDIANRILLSLPEVTFQRLMRIMGGPMRMARGKSIDHISDPVTHLYFINRGLVSLVKTMHDGRMVEVSAIGIEGITDPHALFGMNIAAIDTIVQVPGEAYRIERQALVKEMERDNALLTIMLKYATFAVGQLAQNSACNRLHSMEERCCRWLLRCSDSARADTFWLTHEFLAEMLGVQRSGITLVAKTLQKAGMIDYVRGRVTIIDRRGLEEAACECYATVCDQLDQLFPESQPRVVARATSQNSSERG